MPLALVALASLLLGTFVGFGVAYLFWRDSRDRWLSLALRYRAQAIKWWLVSLGETENDEVDWSVIGV